MSHLDLLGNLHRICPGSVRLDAKVQRNSDKGQSLQGEDRGRGEHSRPLHTTKEAGLHWLGCEEKE